MYYKLFAWLESCDEGLDLDVVEDDDGETFWELRIPNPNSVMDESLDIDQGDSVIVFHRETPAECFEAANDWIAANRKGG